MGIVLALSPGQTIHMEVDDGGITQDFSNAPELVAPSEQPSSDVPPAADPSEFINGTKFVFWICRIGQGICGPLCRLQYPILYWTSTMSCGGKFRHHQTISNHG